MLHRDVTMPRTQANDYAARAGMSDETVAARTGRTWREWVQLLDRHGARDMKHRDIAALVGEQHDVPGWWSQMVTVGYERIKGLRDRGQRLDGKYEASKSRTFDVPVGTLFDAWADARVRGRWLAARGVKVRTATRPKALRLGWSDGTIVAAWFQAKGRGKSTVAIAHTKLSSRETADRLKEFWAEQFDKLAAVLAGR